MAAGGFGFKTINAPQHIGYKGRPLACRMASRDELKAYANVLQEPACRAGPVLGIAPTIAPARHQALNALLCYSFFRNVRPPEDLGALRTPGEQEEVH